MYQSFIKISFLVLFCMICDCQCSDYLHYSHVGMSYKFYDIGMNWTDAYNTCRNENASLAMPKNEDEMGILVHIFNMYPSTIFMNIEDPNILFLGFHHLFTEGEFLSVKGDPIQYTYHRWLTGDPHFTEQRCGCMNRNGDLKDYPCEDVSIFMCEREISSPEDRIEPSLTYSFSENLRKSYRLHMDPRTWGVARTICEAEGGHLAIITNKEEEQHLKEILNMPENNVTYLNIGNYYAFLGFHDLFTEGHYITVTDKNLYDIPYVNWMKGEPNGGRAENCLGLTLSGSIADFNCNNPSVFFCEKIGHL